MITFQKYWLCHSMIQTERTTLKNAALLGSQLYMAGTFGEGDDGIRLGAFLWSVIFPITEDQEPRTSVSPSFSLR